MENKEKISGGRKAIYFSIFAFFLLLLVEGLLSIFFYQKSGAQKLASIETLKTVKKHIVPQSFDDLNVTNHNLVRPDSSQEVNHKIAEETILSNKFVHEPWVEYRINDFEGKYMNIDNGVRKTVPDSYFSGTAEDTIDIYFFGGSTMFGFNVLDHETIPSQFAELYKQHFPAGKSLRVHNYGVPTYYSYQELVLFSNLLFSGHKPDVVIFLDGLNDFWFATASYYRQSYFSYIFRQVFNRGLRSKGEFHFIDTSEAMFRDPAYVSKPVYNSGLVNNYIDNMENIRMMASMIGAEAYFFCQPSPFYNYPNQQKDPMCFKDTNTRFNQIYPMLEKKSKQLSNFYFMGNMLKDEKGYPFVDGLHYSPKFIRKVAAEMFRQVFGEKAQAEKTARER